ncbi:hypothetical protein ACFLXC_01990, partial [Chloroflexota bacterium]
HFKDQALDNRCIYIHIQVNITRSRSDYLAIPKGAIDAVIEDLQKAASIVLPDSPVWPVGISPRVAETYDPILRLAQLCEDNAYLAELNDQLKIADAAFKDGQTYEPKALVIRGLVACLTTSHSGNDTLNLNKSVEITEICKYLQNNYQRGLVPRQAAESLRELGFDLRVSGGKTKVMGITAPQLARACQEIGIADELVAKTVGGTP